MTILLANLMIGVGTILHGILSFMLFVIIAQVVISWVNADPYNPIVRFITGMTEPPIRFIRRRIPTTVGSLDFAPMILMIVVALLQYVLADSLQDWGMELKRHSMLAVP